MYCTGVIVCLVYVWPRGRSCWLVWWCVISLTCIACQREADRTGGEQGAQRLLEWIWSCFGSGSWPALPGRAVGSLWSSELCLWPSEVPSFLPPNSQHTMLWCSKWAHFQWLTGRRTPAAFVQDVFFWEFSESVVAAGPSFLLLFCLWTKKAPERCMF